MTFDSYLTRQGFEHDPFASTNSELEERLSDYFVPPPYFESVLGNPSSPKSNVVFAPRGSGKTAQRRMIEAKSAEDGSQFLCLTYDHFDQVLQSQASLAAHQVALCRLLTLGILARLQEDPVTAMFLTAHEREVIKVAAERYVGGLSMGEYEQAVGAVKTLGDKAADFWRTYGGPVAAGIALLMKKAGLDDVSISVTLQNQARESTSATTSYFLQQLVSIAKELGWDSVYFLIDRVDETTSTTNNAEAAYRLVSELVLHLPTIEIPGVAFKFFFWDKMESYLRQNGLRSDRMEVVTLQWTVAELAEMLARRLRSYSNGKVEDFNSLLDDRADLDVQLLLAHLSYGSPRDLIRMTRAIIAEHTRLPNEPDLIPLSTVFRGIQGFSKESTNEKYGQYLKDFSRISEASFTLTRLGNDVFKVSGPAVTNKVQAWIAAGAVMQLGTLPNPGTRPHNLYGFTDLRIILATCAETEIELALDNYALECRQCSDIVIAAETELVCPNCGAQVTLGDSRSLLRIASDSLGA